MTRNKFNVQIPVKAMNILGPRPSTQAQCLVNDTIDAELSTINVGLSKPGGRREAKMEKQEYRREL